MVSASGMLIPIFKPENHMAFSSVLKGLLVLVFVLCRLP